ncbi:MAG: hypothetical protein ACRD3A_01880 [Terriglobales bacterium]
MNTAASNYRERYPHQGYPASLQHLGPPEAGGSGASAAGLVDRELASGKKHGYILTYAATDSDGDGIRDAYTIHADPEEQGGTGERHFFSDSTSVIRFAARGRADAQSPPLQ